MFDLLIVGYLFLGGFGGALCLVLSLMGATVPRAYLRPNTLYEYRSFFQSGYAFTLAVLVIACFCLLADARASNAILLVFLSGRITYLSVGAYALIVSMAACLVLVVAWSAGGVGGGSFLKGVQAVAVLSGLVVVLYTGFFLSGMRAVPVWNTGWLVALFAFSSLSCALASVFLVAQFANAHEAFRGYFRRLAVVDACVIVLESASVVAFVAAALLGGDGGSASAAARDSALVMLAGSLALAFWMGFVGAGLVLPLFFDLMMAAGRLTKAGLLYLSPAAFASTLIGAFFLRYCLVSAGSHPAASLIGA